MSAPNADDANTDNTGRQEQAEGTVMISAITNADVHLGDGRILHGRGNGEHGTIDPDTRTQFEFPNKAKVTPEVADILVKMGKAKRA